MMESIPNRGNDLERGEGGGGRGVCGEDRKKERERESAIDIGRVTQIER